jgi:hypothetical protein
LKGRDRVELLQSAVTGRSKISSLIVLIVGFQLRKNGCSGAIPDFPKGSERRTFRQLSTVFYAIGRLTRPDAFVPSADLQSK